MFFSSYEQPKSKQWFYRNFAFAFPALFKCKKWRVKIVLITAAAEATCCSILMSGVIVEAEMYDTNNKRSLDLSEFEKDRCLNF